MWLLFFAYMCNLKEHFKCVFPANAEKMHFFCLLALVLNQLNVDFSIKIKK